jgi:hypothetical protein
MVFCDAANVHEALFIKRKREVTGEKFCQTVVFGWLMEPECTAEGLAQIGREFGLAISPQGLDQRFTKEAADYLQAVLSDTISQRIECDQATHGMLEQFDHVYIEDSSVVALPEELVTLWRGCGNGSVGKGNSSIKLQVRWELKRGNLDGPHLFNGRHSDNQAVLAHRSKAERCLTIDDRGYWFLERFAQEADREQAWLSYMKQTTCVVIDGISQKIDVYLQTCQVDELDQAILLGKTQQIPCRLLAKRLPTKLAQKRRRAAKKKAHDKGRIASTATLTLCDWVVMVTNLSAEQLSLAAALDLIRVRWQIELLFKLWKSGGRIDHFRSDNPWRVLCQLYAKLIGMVLIHWFLLASVWHFPDRSLFKAAQVIRRHLFMIALAINDSDLLLRSLTRMVDSLRSGNRIKASQKDPRTFQMMLALDA